jgi:hypothetical protein
MRYRLWSRILVLLLSITASSASVQHDRSETDAVYDAYFHGIRTTELSVRPAAGGASIYTIRRKDWRTGKWGASTSADADTVADNASFALTDDLR